MPNPINDIVEELYLDLQKDPAFMRLREAQCNEDTQEGTLLDDDTVAALMLRRQAIERRHPDVADLKLSVLRRALNTVERRFGVNKTRRDRSFRR
jgi:hypothetical protein